MIKLITITLYILFPYASTFAGDNIDLFSHESSGIKYSYSISEEKLAKLPRWDTKKNPPLSIDAAISKALVDAKRKYRKYDGFKLFAIDLRKVFWPKKYQNIWYYNIGLHPIIDGHEIYEGYYGSVILMDGSVLEPKVSQN